MQPARFISMFHHETINSITLSSGNFFFSLSVPVPVPVLFTSDCLNLQYWISFYIAVYGNFQGLFSDFPGLFFCISGEIARSPHQARKKLFEEGVRIFFLQVRRQPRKSRKSWKSWWAGGGGGGDSDPFLPPFLKIFLGQFSRHRKKKKKKKIGFHLQKGGAVGPHVFFLLPVSHILSDFIETFTVLFVLIYSKSTWMWSRLSF